jgi:hypothetical protein
MRDEGIVALKRQAKNLSMAISSDMDTHGAGTPGCSHGIAN